MQKESDRSIVKAVTVAKSAGAVADINLFSIMKNESYFLPSFFDHYRKLGVQHFFILDDQSTDETTEFLAAQSDCTLLRCTFAFGQIVKIRSRFRFWNHRKTRVGVELKRLLPGKVCHGKWCVYADADEFLVLPARFSGLDEYLSGIDAKGHSLAVSSMTAFYPERLRDIEVEGLKEPTTFEDLVSIAPFFEGAPTFQFDQESRVQRAGPTVDQRLLRSHGLLESKQRGWGGIHKVSIFRPGRRLYLKGSHNASQNPSADFFNCVAHFKYTPDIFRRIQLALDTRAWASESKKYVLLEKLLDSMRRNDDLFLGEKSMRYRCAAQLEDLGLIKYEV